MDKNKMTALIKKKDELKDEILNEIRQCVSEHAADTELGKQLDVSDILTRNYSVVKEVGHDTAFFDGKIRMISPSGEFLLDKGYDGDDWYWQEESKHESTDNWYANSETCRLDGLLIEDLYDILYDLYKHYEGKQID
ncbi:MAG: hypothetical protein PUF37_00800 [Prevotellaceae bacterium]|nr:hypothetical protein [Prevotellaceae bacterium]